MQGERLHVYGVGEKGERGRSHPVGGVHAELITDADVECMKEGKRSNLRKLLDILPVAEREIDARDLLCVGRKGGYGPGGITVTNGYI